MIDRLEGRDLREVLRRRRRLPADDLLAALRPALDALDVAHRRGVVHGDVRPENVRFGEDGRAYVLGLGVARSPTGGDDGRGDADRGPLEYLAPEVGAERRRASPTSDVYALGVLLYEALAGRLPFSAAESGEVLRLQREADPRLGQAAPDLTPAIVRVVERCLVKDPAGRFASAGGVLSALEAAVLESAPPPGAGPAPTPEAGAADDARPDSGDALRARLDVRYGGEAGRLFLFHGTRLRFGRNRARGSHRENDLVLRAFPARPDEGRKTTSRRTRNVSGHHGTLVVTRDGVAVRDDGSTLGTRLDGRELVRDGRSLAAPEDDVFLLEVGRTVGLRGRIFRAGDPDGAHPVAALRLERTRDGEHHSYVLLLGEATIGSDGARDVFALPHAGVEPGHARLACRDGAFWVGAARPDAPVATDAHGPLAPGRLVRLAPDDAVRLGEARLVVAEVVDDDMKPG